MATMRSALVGILAAVSACAGVVSPAAGAETTVLKLGNVQAPGAVVQKGLQRFAELVKERTGGALEIQIFPASQLGTEQEILEGVQLGTIAMYEGSAAADGRFLPQLEGLACLFLWRDATSMVAAVRGPVGDELSRALLDKRGMRILDSGWVFGVRHLTTTKTPVRSPADMRGLKVRVQPDAIYLATVRAMGGSPTPIDAKEVYTSLQTGVVDGQENPISNIYQRKYHEVQKYLVLTGHITQNQVIVIGEAVYRRLTPEQQGILTTAAREAGDHQNELVAVAEAEDLGRLKAGGMEVVEPDVAAFRAAAADVCRDPAIGAKLGEGFYERLVAAAGR
ncbi:MAG TPA: TRAP transporter substrate-binding protein [Geminicoccaceae bacterium]